MPAFTSSVQLITLFCSGLALFGVGVIQAFFPKMALIKKTILCLSFLLGATAIAASIVSIAAWYVFGVVVVGWCVAAVIASDLFHTALTRCLVYMPRRPWLPLALLGLVLGMGSVYYEERQEAQQLQSDEAYNSGIVYKPAMKETTEFALTDEGHPIKLMIAAQSRTQEETAFWERHFLEGGSWYERVISRVPPNDNSNCHGWVFTGGCYWISPQDVDNILKENHYQVVATPQPGDLAIYHDESGILLHSAIVRGMIDKDVLVEGKWGILGVYLHLAQSCIYGGDVTYYRSQRQGHLLNAVPRAGGSANPTFIKKD